MAFSSHTTRGLLTLLGGFLIHLTLGTLYTFGNMNPYLTSYLRQHSQSHDVLQTQAVWIFALSIFGQGGFMMLGGLIESKIGTRFTALLGGWIMSGGVILTALTIKVNFALTIITYGVMFGIGTGIAYAVVISAAMTWFPNHRGVVGGVVVAGFGGGALIFDQVQTYYINPHNFPPNTTVDHQKYFEDERILSRVPSCLFLIGGIYAGLQLLGCLLIRHPKTTESGTLQNSETGPILSTHEDENEDEIEVAEVIWRPLEIIRTRAFWSMWASFFFNSQAIVFISTLYKTFGQQFIDDDFFLAVVGSLAAVMNASFRIVWGKLHDRFPYKWLMVILSLTLCISCMVFPQSKHVDKSFYLIWVCLMFGAFSGNFALFPAATSKYFGHKYMSINYGMVFTSNALAGVTGALLSNYLSSRIGVTGVFYLGGSAAFIAMISAFIFKQPATLPHMI